MLTTQTT